MKPTFTKEQLARQERWRHEERFSKASFIITLLSLIPSLAILFPILPVVAAILPWIDYGLKFNRNSVLHKEQQALNREKKAILKEKDDILTKLEKLNAFKVQPVQLHKPRNIESEFGKVQLSGAMNIMRPVDTTHIKPTNVLLHTRGKETQSGPLNIE
jgi:hypothetical protein